MSIKTFFNNTHLGLFLWWGLIILILFWVMTFKQDTEYKYDYVYACPRYTNTSKCYELKAEYYKDEGTTFINKIYFNNGGYIRLVDCYIEYGEERTDVCVEDDDYLKDWEIEFVNQ